LRLGLVLMVVVSVLLGVLAWPQESRLIQKIGIEDQLKIRRGLDLQGGAYLVYEADMSQLPEGSNQQEVLDNAAKVIERRVNPGGVGEVVVQTAANNRIVVQLPGVNDPAEAEATIGRTAQLNFFEVSLNNSPEAEITEGFAPTEINGEDVKRATVDFPAGSPQPIVSLELKDGESTQQFADLTTELAANGNQLVTMLDQQVVFGPASVQQPITTGEAQLSGGFDVQTAQEIADLLNAGALPVPVNLVAQQTIGPTLGELSIKQSVVAAAIGLISVSLFLVLYYRLSGAVAVLGLVFYSLLMIAILKLSVFTPYVMVLTLAGIAGFILSIAVAVDTNVLILERFKEELRAKATTVAAFEAGYTHAWTSIRDANAATLIATLILYNFGTPAIKGFALTLGVGVAVNLLTAATVTKLLMRLLARSRLRHSPQLVRLGAKS
jgi:preprotein translocase subunit SecD